MWVMNRRWNSPQAWHLLNHGPRTIAGPKKAEAHVKAQEQVYNLSLLTQIISTSFLYRAVLIGSEIFQVNVEIDLLVQNSILKAIFFFPKAATDQHFPQKDQEHQLNIREFEPEKQQPISNIWMYFYNLQV